MFLLFSLKSVQNISGPHNNNIICSSVKVKKCEGAPFETVQSVRPVIT